MHASPGPASDAGALTSGSPARRPACSAVHLRVDRLARSACPAVHPRVDRLAWRLARASTSLLDRLAQRFTRASIGLPGDSPGHRSACSIGLPGDSPGHRSAWPAVRLGIDRLARRFACALLGSSPELPIAAATDTPGLGPPRLASVRLASPCPVLSFGAEGPLLSQRSVGGEPPQTWSTTVERRRRASGPHEPSGRCRVEATPHEP
jgi:hypothetical protein